MSAGLDKVLGPAYAALAERVEGDLRDHVADLNERRRNLLTVRGLGITSVSALLTATVVSGQGSLAALALVVVLVVVYVDLDANRRIQSIEKRLRFMEETGRRVRRALALQSTTSPILRTLRIRLRAYNYTPSGTDEVRWGIEVRRPVRLAPFVVQLPFRRVQKGALRIGRALGGFGWLYGVLALGCCVSVSIVGDDTKTQLVIGCLVPAATDVRAVVRDGRCVGPTARSPKRPSCGVPGTLRGSRMTIRCTRVEGPVLVVIQHGGVPVVLQRATVGRDGRAVIAVGRLHRGWTYRVTMIRNGQVLAASRAVTIA